RGSSTPAGTTKPTPSSASSSTRRRRRDVLVTARRDSTPPRYGGAGPIRQVPAGDHRPGSDLEPAGTHAAPLAAVPEPEGRRIAVRVTPDALRHIRGGHPWVFDRSISSTSHDAPAGSLAVVFDDRRRFAAIGLWDPTSPLRI